MAMRSICWADNPSPEFVVGVAAVAAADGELLLIFFLSTG